MSKQCFGKPVIDERRKRHIHFLLLMFILIGLILGGGEWPDWGFLALALAVEVM